MMRPGLEVPAPQHDLSLVCSAGEHPRDAPQAMATLAAADGTYGFSASRSFPGRQRAADVLPDKALILASHESEGHASTWARCERGSVWLLETSGRTEVVALAVSAEAARDLLDLIARRCREPVDNDVRATLWLRGNNGPSRQLRTFQTQAWDDLARNYPEGTAKKITSLRNAGAPDGSGRLLLWHGPPGTGKTSAVLGLLHAWREWCAADVIADPDQMFLDAAYLVEVLAQSSFQRTWRLIVCEDADEYLRSDARQRSGPGLGRLLNASDGLLGRGTRNLVLLTTNDELGRLHPAVTRPGRCLSLIEFGLFPPAEASRWLGQPSSDAMTLAEMFERKQGGESVRQYALPVGTYL
jgi:hypothetical protein